MPESASFRDESPIPRKPELSTHTRCEAEYGMVVIQQSLENRLRVLVSKVPMTDMYKCKPFLTLVVPERKGGCKNPELRLD